MKKNLLSFLLFGSLLFGFTGCDKKEKLDVNELNDVNNKIIEYFQKNDAGEYENYSYNYLDEENKVVIVGLVDNSREQQEWFKNNVINSKYLKFEQGNSVANTDKYKDYETISTLQSNIVDVNILVRFNGILYGKSYSIIDYAGGTEAIGKIDQLIPNIYVPKLNGETNTESILNALVFDESTGRIVLYYNNKYVLFEKI